MDSSAPAHPTPSPGPAPASAPASGPDPLAFSGVAAIEVSGLVREYRKDGKVLAALDGIDLTVRRGEIFGLLGPNGAGKTTLIKVLTTLLYPTRGEARVAGYGVVGEEAQVRRRINMVSGGESSGYGLLTVEENLWMFSQFYGLPGKVAMARIDRMLERLELADQRRVRVDSLSTGMRQKMNFIRGLITDPEVLFLDEPTLGLDVRAARQIRGFLREWMAEVPGRTVLLTTHYMFEADELCDRIAIIDRGRILACESPRALKARLGERTSLTIVVDREPRWSAGAIPEGVASHTVRSLGSENAFEAALVLERESDVAGVLRWMLSQGLTVKSLSKRDITLEDVFVSLVGKGLDD
jgi:ABC-2 type transport system ATP-binding protein